MTKTRLLALATLPFAASMVHAQQEVGTLSIIRKVSVTRTPVSQGREYVDAQQGQPVRNNYGLRTGRRSKAEIHFRDRSILRVNERTDMVIADQATLRNIQLNQGAVWVKVAKGVNTTITTPTATATARGTEFEVRSNGEVLVYEGSVAVSAGGQTVLVEAGNKASVGSGGAPNSPIPLTPGEFPQGRGGGTEAWFNDIEEDAGVLTTPGSEDYREVRQETINEFIQNVIGGATSTTVIIREPRLPEIPDSRRELGLIDNTETSYLFPAVGLAASLLADRGNLGDIRPPALHGTLFGYTGTPTFAGARGQATGAIGESTYAYEANVLQFYSRPETDVLGRFGSVLYIERRLNEKLKLFAGRRKFYHGPVFADLADTQLIANRYSGVGVRYDENPFSAEVAYVYDANRFVRGAQQGAVASVFYKALGGMIGGHLLETEDLPGGGHGRSVSASLPVIHNQLDFYGEYGTGIDDTTNETFGFYLPGVFQKTGVDVFLEYGLKRGVAQAYSITGLYEIKRGPQLRGSVEWFNGTNRLSVGAAFRF